VEWVRLRRRNRAGLVHRQRMSPAGCGRCMHNIFGCEGTRAQQVTCQMTGPRPVGGMIRRLEGKCLRHGLALRVRREAPRARHGELAPLRSLVDGLAGPEGQGDAAAVLVVFCRPS